MGFVKSLVTGRPNEFKPTTPVNQFNAREAALDESSYADAIRQAQANALAVNPQQQALADALRAAAAGQGPSVAENQLRQATDQNIQQTAGFVASQRGVNPALAARIAAGLGAQANQRAASDAATLRAQEILAARGQLGDVLGQMGSGATSLAGTTGQLQNAQNTGRIQNVLGTQQINAGVASGNQAAALEAERLKAGVEAGNAQFQGQVIGGLVSGAGAALGSALAPAAPAAAMAAAHGAVVPGRARLPGDSPENDTVPILASPEEIVLPRSVTKAPDAPDRAADFVAAIKARKMGESGGGYGRVLAIARDLDGRLAKLERMAQGGEVKDERKRKPPPDVELGSKRESDLPALQLPVYRGETAKYGRLKGTLTRRMADGGEVEEDEPSLADALRRWWRKEGDAQPESRGVADALNAQLPRQISGRALVESNKRKERMIDAALAGER